MLPNVPAGAMVKIANLVLIGKEYIGAGYLGEQHGILVLAQSQ